MALLLLTPFLSFAFIVTSIVLQLIALTTTKLYKIAGGLINIGVFRVCISDVCDKLHTPDFDDGMYISKPR